MYFLCVEGLFTPKISVDASVDVHVDAWKEYIDFNCNINSDRFKASVKKQMGSGLTQKR